ncbi:MAG: SAM-dependent methyltransferase, partial [Clostridia bacterium]|nr:SAM-dependent methyltransferase [Clostridia bacterium]
MKTSSGLANTLNEKNVARHEVFGTIGDFCKCGARTLKFGGTFAVVYRPDRLVDLVSAMREAKLEPKRMTFVHARADSQPSMVLIEAKLCGGAGLTVTKPLIIYSDGDRYSPDMNYIMENGSFPADFSK